MSYYRRKSPPAEIDLEALTKEYLAKGGTVTKCEPGASEEVRFKGGWTRRSRPKAEDAAE